MNLITDLRLERRVRQRRRRPHHEVGRHQKGPPELKVQCHVLSKSFFLGNSLITARGNIYFNPCG